MKNFIWINMTSDKSGLYQGKCLFDCMINEMEKNGTVFGEAPDPDNEDPEGFNFVFEKLNFLVDDMNPGCEYRTIDMGLMVLDVSDYKSRCFKEYREAETELRVLGHILKRRTYLDLGDT